MDTKIRGDYRLIVIVDKMSRSVSVELVDGMGGWGLRQKAEVAQIIFWHVYFLTFKMSKFS